MSDGITIFWHPIVGPFREGRPRELRTRTNALQLIVNDPLQLFQHAHGHRQQVEHTS